MPTFRVRRIGNSPGVLFPKDFVAQKRLKRDDVVHVSVDAADDLESIRGSLAHLGFSVDEMNDLTNECEEL